MNWIKDEEDYYHNLDDFCQINVVYDDDFCGEKKYAVRAHRKSSGCLDLYHFDTLEEAKLHIRNIMLRFI